MADAFTKGGLKRKLGRRPKSPGKKENKGKSKEELAALRKNMMKKRPKRKTEPNKDSDKTLNWENMGSDKKKRKQASPNQDLLNRLISGKAHKVSKKDTKRLAMKHINRQN